MIQEKYPHACFIVSVAAPSQNSCKFQATVDWSLQLEDSWVSSNNTAKSAAPWLVGVLSYVDAAEASWRGVHSACEMTR
jgi:hypothetical protein